MEFALIWYSQYGKEEIDTTTNSQEAIRLRTNTKWLMALEPSE